MAAKSILGLGCQGVVSSFVESSKLKSFSTGDNVRLESQLCALLLIALVTQLFKLLLLLHMIGKKSVVDRLDDKLRLFDLP